MKKIIVSIAVLLFSYAVSSQVLYFKGEWTKVNTTELFTSICRIEIKDGQVSGELLWTYLAADSSDAAMVEYYKGKKGKKGIEFIEGTYDAATGDIYFEGKSKTDPSEVIGEDKYTLKFSANKQVLYGITDSNGSKNGLFYAAKASTAVAAQEFAAAKRKIK